MIYKESFCRLASQGGGPTAEERLRGMILTRFLVQKYKQTAKTLSSYGIEHDLKNVPHQGRAMITLTASFNSCSWFAESSCPLFVSACFSTCMRLWWLRKALHLTGIISDAAATIIPIMH